MFFYRDFFYVIINIFFGYSCAFKLCNVVRNYVITLLCNYVILSLIRGENYIKKICAKKNNYIICAVKKLHKKMIQIKKCAGWPPLRSRGANHPTSSTKFAQGAGDG